MYKVLLVDDEILVRDAMKQTINWESLGYELVGDCENGRDAIDFIDRKNVDLVLTDICMPYVDGIELCKYLYENYPEIKVVIFSGFSDFEYAKQAIRYKVVEYMLKPITAVELRQLLIGMKEKFDSTMKEKNEKYLLKKTYKNYKKSHNVIRASLLKKLVLGTQSVGKTLGELEEVGVTLRASEYQVCVIEIDRFSKLYEIKDEEKMEASLMGFAVENISNEIITKYNMGISFQEDTRVNLLLYSSPVKSNTTIHDICNRIREKVYEIIKLTLTIGIGTRVMKIEDLNISYTNALEAINYRFTLGEGRLLDMENIYQRGKKDISLDDLIKELIIAMKSNSVISVNSIFTQIGQKIIEYVVSPNRVYLFCQQIIRTIIVEFSEIKGSEIIGDQQKNLLFDKIVNSKSLEDALMTVQNFTLFVLEEVGKLNQTNAKRQALLATDYIKKNYGDNNLNLNGICTYLSISTSHFSSLFKESTGKTFMEYLIGVRMDKAKELIEQTTLKNYEIAERVGFSDPHYFSISFKRATGMSPTEYAKEKRKNGR